MKNSEFSVLHSILNSECWILCSILIACSDSRPRPEPKPEPPPSAPQPEGHQPDWQKRIPDIPGTAVLTWANGPILKDSEIRVGSNAIGVAAIEPRFGTVLWQNKDGSRFDERSDDPDILFSGELAGTAVRITRTTVERDGKWTYERDEEIDIGVSDPIVAHRPYGGMLMFVADGTLVGLDWDTGKLQWSASGRYSNVTGALASYRAASWPVGAVAITPDGVGSRAVDVETGEIVREQLVAGERVVAADWWGVNLALVAHRDQSLLHTTVYVIDLQGLRWEWDLPRPDGPRVDPIGVLIADDAVFVFYDGRYLVRLPL